MSEDEILKDDVRQKIVDEIEQPENQHRKDEAYRRFEVWRDRTKKFVRHMLRKQLNHTTVEEMEYAMANISVVRKIIDKLAKVYTNGVVRSFDDDGDTECLNLLEKKLKATTNMKTVNRLLKLHRNAALYIKPTQFIDGEGNTKFKPVWQPMSPYLYDVVEQFYDRTKPLVYIFSNYEIRHQHHHGPNTTDSFARRGHGHGHGHGHHQHGDRRDQKIADKKEDTDIDLPKKKYVWWTDKWHFTTMGSGIVDPVTLQPFTDQEDLEKAIINPIEEIPVVDYHIDQEGYYWAEGGEDLIDGGILINALLSNAHHIGVTQGFGQLVLTGRDLPSTVLLGPNKTINLAHNEEEPQPTAQFITSNPPLQDLANQVEMYLALLLTTNNLSTSGISSKLEGGMAAPSGIALALDKAESLEDVKDQRSIFEDGEIPAWRKTAKWIEVFSQQNELDSEFDECKIPVEEDIKTEFKEPNMIMSEAEKLTNLNTRKTLGINTEVELIMDDRGINKEEAEKVLLEIQADKLRKMADMMGEGGHTHELNGERIPSDSVDPGAPHDHGGTVESAPNNPGHIHQSEDGPTGPDIEVGSQEDESQQI